MFKHLQKRAKKQKWTEVRWVADEGQTPGWDIQYKDAHGKIQAVEVKTTTGRNFSNVELTAGEWIAAEKKREDYQLVLVANIYGEAKLQFIKDPFGWVEAKRARIEPLVYQFVVNAE